MISRLNYENIVLSSDSDIVQSGNFQVQIVVGSSHNQNNFTNPEHVEHDDETDIFMRVLEGKNIFSYSTKKSSF